MRQAMAFIPTSTAKLSLAFAAATLLILLSGCAHSQPKATDAADTEPLLEIIDAHIHTRFDGKAERSSGLTYSKEQLLKEMKANNVVGAIAHARGDGTGYVDLTQNGIIHCAGLDPKVNAKQLESDLKSGKFRCIKVYLGYVSQWAYSPNYEPAYKLAEKYDVPVVFHTGDTYSTTAELKYADPLTIDEVAVKHPKVRFVIAHCGNPWIESAAEVAYKNPNVWLDGSAFLIGNLESTSKEKIDTYVVKPLSWIFGYVEDPSKLMYGTDWPLADMHSTITAFKRAIPKEHWKAVFHDNAVKVFKLKTK